LQEATNIGTPLQPVTTTSPGEEINPWAKPMHSGKLRRKRKHAHYLNTRNGEDHLNDQAARRKSRKATREAAKAYEQRIAQDAKKISETFLVLYENQM
jgi:hypothetical protein